MLALLAQGERSAGELVEAFPQLTQPAVSRHLRILREALSRGGASTSAAADLHTPA